ncbi:hypothetical protein TNIN_172301 [Trichonephila inaurata madagascariensis]|uniref:Uncharacterized protein n=1 Tax=Trichonephila inaurata madagascariensis TaxID=2747483 RepID=A0A8X6ISD0_9ARAC|nr:hypothetical protein TNIN_172301 [Trichonephila inaurata madagascariensis]
MGLVCILISQRDPLVGKIRKRTRLNGSGFAWAKNSLDSRDLFGGEGFLPTGVEPNQRKTVVSTKGRIKTFLFVLGAWEGGRRVLSSENRVTSREQLRNFTGFAPDFDIEDYSTVILKKLNLPDLICLANFLQLETNGTAEELCNNILLSLADLSTFQTKLNTRGVEECPPRVAQKSFAFPPLSTDRKSADASISQNDLSWLFVKDLLQTLRSFSADDSYTIEHFFF